MSIITSLADLNGLAKQVYGENLIELKPKFMPIVDRIKFSQRDMLGDSYHVPAIVAMNQGVTYAGPTEDGFTLNDSVAMVSQDASLKGYQIALTTQIGYKLAASAAAKGPKAFADATRLIIDDLMDQGAKRVEMAAIYGQVGLGQVVSSANVSATETELTFSQPTWGPGLFIGQANAPIDFYNGVTLVATVAVKRISNVNTRKLRVTGTAGQITALDAALPGTLDAYWKGAFGKEMVGLDKILTTSGVLFGIDNTVYDLWKAQSFSAGSAALTFDKATEALVNAILFGLDKKVTLVCSPRTWQDLNKDEAALRNYDYSYKPSQAEKGVEGIRFKLMNVDVEILAHNMIKEGEAFIFDFDDLMRVGAYDLSMQTPGHGGELFRQVDGKTAFELRAYTDQALFARRPARMVKITAIVNS
jgi:hypothetical protein